VRGVAKLPAFLTLGVSGEGEHLLHSLASREEVERGEKGESVGRGHRNNHGGCRFLTARFWVRVKVTRRENADSPGIADGLMKRGEELVVI